MLIAHIGRPPAPHDLWTSWNLDPFVAVPLALGVWLFVRGLARVPDRLRPTRARIAATAFAGVLLAVAVFSPLDALGTALASVHMVQHLLLTFAAAPLLAFGRPWQLTPWALDRPARKALGRHRSSWRPAASALSGPWLAGMASVATLSVWHGRVPYEAALASPLIHTAQHLSFLAAGVLFWSAVGRGVQRSALNGSTILLIFLVAMHGVFLAALMTFAGQPWYPSYRATAPQWGMSPLADQHLAGVIMWVWGSLMYVGAAVGAMTRWIDASDEAPLELATAER